MGLSAGTVGSVAGVRTSAGLLAFRRTGSTLEVLLAHPGGPFWANKDFGAWSVPKGETEPGEDLLDAARREFREETAIDPPSEGYIFLGDVQQRGGKSVHAWGVEMDLDPAAVVSNTFDLEWPPRSGRYIEVPEVDRVEWFDLATARHKINPAQQGFIDELERQLVC